MELAISRSVLDNVPEEILIIDVENYTIIDVNKALLEALKLSREEVVGKTCYAVTHRRSSVCVAPDDICPISEMLRTGKPVSVEHTHFSRDGSPVYVQVSASPIKDKTGKITHAVHMAQDITERKRLELDLLRFKLGVERSGNVVFLTETDGRIIYVNGMFEKIYGYTREEAIGKTPRILKSGTLPGEVYKQFWDTLLAGKVFAGEIINKTKDGRLLTMEGSANPIIGEHDTVLGFLVIQHDITERKRMEEELKCHSVHLEELVEQKVGELLDSEARFRAISSSAKDAIIVLDDEDRISYLNSAAEGMFGYAQGEVLGKYMHDLFAPIRYRERYLAGLEKFWETGQGALIGKTVEFVAVRKGGLEFPIELSLSAFQLGGKWHAAGMVRDITERKQLQAHLRDITYKLGGVAQGGCYVSESFERTLRIFFNLTSHGVRGLAIVREDPDGLVKDYGLKPETIMLLAPRPLKGFPVLSNMQDVSLAVSNFLKDDGGVVLLDGLEYLASMFGFDAVYRFIQEKRFDFLSFGALLLVPINMAAFSSKEVALLESELKLLEVKT